MKKRKLYLIPFLFIMFQIITTGLFQNTTLTVYAQQNPWVATPYTDENGNVIEGLEEAVTKSGKESWLETTRDMPTSVTVDEVNKILTIENEVIKREFKFPHEGGSAFYTQSYKNMYTEQEFLKDEVKPDVYLGLYDKSYNQVYDRQTILFDPDYYFVGGTQVNNTFVFDGYEIFDQCEEPFAWTPRSKPYSNPSASEWPPPGKRVVFNFSAPTTFPIAYQGITIKVIYEMYDGISAMKKRVEIKNTSEQTIVVGKIAPEVLNVKENMNNQLYIDTNYRAEVGHTPLNAFPCDYGNEEEGSIFKELENIKHRCYPIGPAYQLKQNEEFITYDTYELLHSTYWFELRGKEIKGMYLKLFPWITDNPLTYHNTKALTKSVIDYVAEAGFELIFQSFGAPDSTGQMMTRDQATLDHYRELINYAHTKGIDIGIYQAQYLLGQYKVNKTYGINGIGKWGTWCLASAAFDDYWDNFKHFIEYTGIDCISMDGAYPGCPCDNGEHHVNSDRETDPGDPNDTSIGDPSKYKIHYGYYDSTVKQWENGIRTISKFLRDNDIYARIPDWYFLNGGNKAGIGYEEIAWSEPRKEQFIYGRQIIYNSNYSRPTSTGWSHIPFSQYHGGGDEAIFTPFHEKIDDYNWVLAQNLGNGVTGDFRGNSLYDDESLEVMKKWVNFYKKYRGIIDSDMVKISQATYADGSNRQTTIKLDTLYHANAKNDGEKGLLWVYNQSEEERTEIITVPMYYTGLTNMTYPNPPLKGSLGKNVKTYGEWPPDYSWIPTEEASYMHQQPVKGIISGRADFAREGIDVSVMDIDSNGNALLEVTLPPMSFTYYLIYNEGEAPDKTVQVGQVNNVSLDSVTGSTATIKWDKDVDLSVIENGVVDDNPSIVVDHFNIYRNGSYIGKSITNSYKDEGLQEDTSYEYKIEAVVAGVKGEMSNGLTVTTIFDNEKPVVLNIIASSDNEVKIIFNETIDPITSSNIANYSITPDTTIYSATVDVNQVTLVVDPLTILDPYTITVDNIADTAIGQNIMDPIQRTIYYGSLRSYPLDTITNNKTPEVIELGEIDIKNANIVESNMGNVVKLDSSKQAYADLGTGLLDDLDNYSISLWFNTSDQSKQVILSQGQDDIVVNDFTLIVENSIPQFNISNTDGSKIVNLVSSKAINIGRFNHLSIICNNGVYSMYLNGNMVANQTVSDMDSNYANTMYLGAITNSAGGARTHYYNGLISSVKLFKVSLTEQQISDLYYSYPISTRLNLLSDGNNNVQAMPGDVINFTLEPENLDVDLSGSAITYTISEPSAVILDETNNTITLNQVESTTNTIVSITASTTVDGRQYQSNVLKIIRPGELETNWKNLTVRNGEWTINENNEFVAPITDKDEVLIRKNLAVSEGIVEADIMLGSDSAQSQGLAIGWGNDTSAESKRQGYLVIINDNRVRLHKTGTGDLATVNYTAIPNTWISLKCEFKDGSIEVYVDGELMITYTNNVNIVDDSYVGFFSVVWPYNEGVEPPRYKNFVYSPLTTICTVTFNSNGGTVVSPIEDVPVGTSITLPLPPTKAGYVFDGWYTDEAFTTAFTDSTIVNGDLTVYAKWLSELEVDWKNLTVRDGEWTINENNEFVAPITNRDEVLIRKNLAVSEGVVEADIMLGSDSAQSQGLVIGWGNDTSNESKRQGYLAIINDNRVRLHKTGTGDLATVNYTATPNTWVNLKCEFEDGSIRVYVDDVLEITYTDNVNIVDNSNIGLFSVVWPYKTEVESPRYKNFIYNP